MAAVGAGVLAKGATAREAASVGVRNSCFRAGAAQAAVSGSCAEPKLPFLRIIANALPLATSLSVCRSGAGWQRPAGHLPRAGHGSQRGHKAAAAAQLDLLQILLGDAG